MLSPEHILNLKIKILSIEGSFLETAVFEKVKGYAVEEFANCIGELKKNDFLNTPEVGFLRVSKLGKERLSMLLKESKRIERDENKASLDFTLAKWQRTIFWPLFFFGLLGGLYSIYDIAKKNFWPEVQMTKECKSSTPIDSIKHPRPFESKDSLPK